MRKTRKETCEKKRAYKKKSYALGAINKLVNGGKNQFKDAKPYICNICKNWHLTTWK